MYDNYIGIKSVEAMPAPAPKQMGEYPEGSEGYEVRYPDGYTSWCPKAVFERANIKVGHGGDLTEAVENFLVKTAYYKEGNTCVLHATLANKFELVASSTAQYPAEYSHEVGKKSTKETVLREVFRFISFIYYCANNGVNNVDA